VIADQQYDFVKELAIQNNLFPTLPDEEKAINSYVDLF
jgi:hypothetical protein